MFKYDMWKVDVSCTNWQLLVSMKSCKKWDYNGIHHLPTGVGFPNHLQYLLILPQPEIRINSPLSGESGLAFQDIQSNSNHDAIPSGRLTVDIPIKSGDFP